MPYVGKVVCPEDYTEQDEYNTYPDCHIWAPFYLVMDGFVIVTALVVTIFAVRKACTSQKEPHKRIAFFATMHALIMFCCYTARLWTGLVTGHRNVALNFFYGLSTACLWVEHALISLQYLEVLLVTEKLKGKTEILLKRVRFLFRLFMIGCFFGAILSFLIPSIIPSLRIDIGYWIMAIFGLSVYTAVVWYSGLTLRNMLGSMEVSKSFYRRLIRKLDFFLIPWTVAAIPTLILLILILILPFFLRNMYVVFGLVSWSTLIGNGLIIMSISGSIYSKLKDKDSQQSGQHSGRISLSHSGKGSGKDISVRGNRSPSTVQSTPQTPYSKIQLDRVPVSQITLPSASSTPILSLRSLEQPDSKELTPITPLNQSEISNNILPTVDKPPTIDEVLVPTKEGINNTEDTESRKEIPSSPQSMERELTSPSKEAIDSLDSSRTHELLLGPQSR